MLFIPSDDHDHDDDDGDSGRGDHRRRKELVRRQRSWKPIGHLDRSSFSAWRAFDEIEIPSSDLCISFSKEEEAVGMSHGAKVPRIWSLPPSS